jgi:hypothetical protein
MFILTYLHCSYLVLLGDNQQQGEEEEVGLGEEEGLEGDLLNGLAFECVVSIWKICNCDPLFCVILDL